MRVISDQWQIFHHSQNFLNTVFEVVNSWANTFISEHQDGFTAGRSVEMNLVDWLAFFVSEVYQRGQFDVIYLDLCKAFDMVDHELLDKLRHYGMSCEFLKWMRSYLSGRRCVVRCNGVVGSSMFKAIRGFPQGSVLGTLLFKIFVNDFVIVLADVVRILFADDTKLGRSIRSVDDCLRLQAVLDLANEWVKRETRWLSMPKNLLWCRFPERRIK